MRIVKASGKRSEGIFTAREINRMVGGIDMLDAQEQGAAEGRTVRSFSDIAVLCRTNRQAEAMEEYLKKEGLWIACADMKGLDHFDTNMKGPLALVIGSEGDGVSRLVKENCDFTASIPMYGKISSLNASVAAALLMYEVVRQRRF